jgi:putative Holliday junction resolvase
MSEGRVMAIDFGTVRLGVALSDPTRTLATPHAVVLNDQQVFVNLATIVARHDVREIVVGLPMTLAGSDSIMTTRARAFAKRLGEKIPLPVTMYDERYTSLIAEEHLRDTGRSRKARGKKGEVDKAAAAVMLQEYLNGLSSRS